MDRIVVNSSMYGERIATRAHVPYNPKHDVNIARVCSDKGLMGGAVFTNYTHASITAHMAGFDPTWINRPLLWCVFNYVFDQLHVKKLFGQVPASNERALALDLKLGFRIEHRVKDVYEDGDMLVLAMYRDDCKWLRLKPPKRLVVGAF